MCVGIQEISVPSSQFYCKPKTVLEKIVFYFLIFFRACLETLWEILWKSI